MAIYDIWDIHAKRMLEEETRISMLKGRNEKLRDLEDKVKALEAELSIAQNRELMKEIRSGEMKKTAIDNFQKEWDKVLKGFESQETQKEELEFIEESEMKL